MKWFKTKDESKKFDPDELLPFCTRCFHVGAVCEDNYSFCHMCGSQNTCINVRREDVKVIQESVDARIEHAIEYGKKQAEVYTMEDCKKDTIEHINQVKEFMIQAVEELLRRANNHDKSKLESPEIEIFAEFTPKLKNSTYLSEEYKKNLEQMQKGLKHHYKYNSHHPEHYKNGINDMDLFDVVEMLCDWIAAVKKHADGDIFVSLEKNKERFNIDDQLQKILYNTVKRYYKQ